MEVLVFKGLWAYIDVFLLPLACIIDLPTLEYRINGGENDRGVENGSI